MLNARLEDQDSESPDERVMVQGCGRRLMNENLDEWVDRKEVCLCYKTMPVLSKNPTDSPALERDYSRWEPFQR